MGELLANILLVASQVGTLFLLMGVGFVLTRLGKLTKTGVAQLTFVLMNIVSPCIIIDTLQVERTPALLRDMGVGVLIMCAVYALWIALAAPAFRRTEADTRDVLRFGMVYGNTGFMGLPLIQAVLGSAGLFYATAPYLVFSVVSWSHGVARMGGRAQLSLKRLLLNPGILGSVIAITLFLLNFRLPAMVGNAVGYLGSMNTPLAMIVVGSQMAGANLGDALRSPRLYLAGAVRLLVCPALLLVLLLPLRLDPTMYAAYVILAATPTAGLTGIFAQRFGRDTAAAAQLITLSTLLSILTLPCFAALAQLLNP
ncbi:AEC family transporter [Lawsonibacter celer]|uniref:AEC family transporter n=1 Tax=Lawsonibacter celer TaxID=2986526 RepID=UPI0016455920|nr:AEC family transporter [Lawsonibacter celer]